MVSTTGSHTGLQFLNWPLEVKHKSIPLDQGSKGNQSLHNYRHVCSNREMEANTGDCNCHVSSNCAHFRALESVCSVGTF